MVVHNRELQEKWAKQRKRQSSPIKKNANQKPHSLFLLSVQCLACTLILLLALLFRVAGGTAYTQLQQGLHRSLAANELVAALMRIWDGDPEQFAEIAEGEDVKEESFTSS